MIVNKTKGRVLASDVKLCDDSLSKARGLMFTKRREDLGLVFSYDHEHIISLHMMFVFYPIDVLFLDLKGKVVEIKRNFMPFTFYSPIRNSSTVIELASGRSQGTEVGHQISF